MQTMTDTKRTLVRDMPNRSRVVATLDIGRGYFSLTGELYEPHGTWSGRARHGERARARLGAAKSRDKVLRAFPKLAGFARMHLSDLETGEPMHAEANGWYWYSSYDGRGHS
jgi:hypothetical protein